MAPRSSPVWHGLAAALGTCLLLFVSLAGLAALTAPPWDLDRWLLTGADRGRDPVWDTLFAGITWAGSLYLLGPLSLLLAGRWLRRWRLGDALLLALGLWGASGWASLAKLFFARPRPELFPGLGPGVDGFSFPSSHAAQVTAFVCALLVAASPRRGPRGLAMVGLLGVAGLVLVSRLYLQRHYPSDVLGGVVLGAGWVLALRYGLAGLGAWQEVNDAQ